MKRKRVKPWLIGILTATALFFALVAFVGLRFASSGDLLILKTFAGYQGGVPAHFHEELHTALAWLLCGLQTIFPTVPWFSVVQLAFLWISSAVIVKSMTQCALRNGWQWWLGMVAGLLFLGAFALMSIGRVDHDTTAVLLGAAAIMQLFGAQYEGAADRQVLSSMLGSVGLLLASYCLYQEAAFVALCLWLLIALMVRLTIYSRKAVASTGTAARRGARGLALGVWICAFCFLMFVMVRSIELSAMGDYAQWQRAHSALAQNVGFPAQVNEQMLAQLGWSQIKLDIIADGFLYDASITTQELLELGRLLDMSAATNLGANLMQSGDEFFTQIINKPILLMSAVLPLSLALLGLIALLLKRCKKISLWLMPFLTASICAAWLYQFSQSGGLGATEVMAVLAPASALFLGFAAGALRPAEQDLRWHGAILGALLVACSVCACLCSAYSMQEIVRLPIEAADSAFEETLERVARQKPDKLIFYHADMARDTRLFPDLSDVPRNIVLPDVRNVHTDGLIDQLELFGIDGRRMKQRDLLKDNVLVAATAKGPWQGLLNYVEENAKGTLNWAKYDQQEDVFLYRMCKR